MEQFGQLLSNWESGRRLCWQRAASAGAAVSAERSHLLLRLRPLVPTETAGPSKISFVIGLARPDTGRSPVDETRPSGSHAQALTTARTRVCATFRRQD
uniref:Kinesin motor domain-containing protein n=1 Tax=Macrostomum lignano TaxID=282301 RepID=A0A1I8FEM8_9PLAT